MSDFRRVFIRAILEKSEKYRHGNLKTNLKQFYQLYILGTIKIFLKLKVTNKEDKGFGSSCCTQNHNKTRRVESS